MVSSIFGREVLDATASFLLLSSRRRALNLGLSIASLMAGPKLLKNSLKKTLLPLGVCFECITKHRRKGWRRERSSPVTVLDSASVLGNSCSDWIVLN